MGNRRRKSRDRRRRVFDDWFEQDNLDHRDLDRDDWRKIRRRVIVDATKKPDTGFPIGLGVAALFVALMFGLGPLLPLVAILVLVAGLASFAGRLFWGFRRLATKTFQRLFESKKARQQRMLDDLDRRLRNDGEPRTQHLLRTLSHLYQTLEQDIQDGTLTVAATDVLESVDQINDLCIEHLDESHRLWEAAQADPYVAKVKLQQRKALIDEVAESVDYLEGIVAQLHERSVNRNRKELKRLRRELDETLDVAKRVEQRTDDLVESDVYEMPE